MDEDVEVFADDVSFGDEDGESTEVASVDSLDSQAGDNGELAESSLEDEDVEGERK